MPTIDQSKVFVPPGRQQAMLTFRCSIYRPAALAAAPGNWEAQDLAFENEPAFINVPSKYIPTPEYGELEPLGITKGDSVLVSDLWRFLADQEVNDGYLIVMTACQAPNTLLGRCWVTQGNSKITSSSPSRPINIQRIFAKLSPDDIIPTGN